MGSEMCIRDRCGNELTRKNAKKKTITGTDEGKMEDFVKMMQAAKEAADQVILVGPGNAATWHLAPEWDIAAQSTVSQLAESGVPNFTSRHCGITWTGHRMTTSTDVHRRKMPTCMRCISLHVSSSWSTRSIFDVRIIPRLDSTTDKTSTGTHRR